MGSERRNCARRILYSPEYLDMGADNGGVVVDLSEGGLRFQAVGRIEANTDVPLSFSLGTGYRIDVEARVVWVSPRGNSGGVAFKKLSSDSRSLIREWLAKPEEEHRAEAVVATPEVEEEQVASGASSGAPVSLAAPAVSAPVATVHPLASEAFEDRPQGARIEEIFAPGPIFTEELPHTAQHVARPIAKSTPAASASQQASPVSNAAPARVPTRNYAPQSIRPAAPAQHPLERKSAANAGPSFSAVPSISQWASKNSPAPRIPARSNPLQSGAPLFPPRGSENIFARNRWEPAEIKERHAGRNLLLIVFLLLVLGSVLLVWAYQNGYRGQIGAAIERVGSTVAGSSGGSTSTAPTSASSSPANSPASTSPSSTAPKNSSPGAAPQSAPPSAAPSQIAPAPTEPPKTSTAANSSPSSTDAAAQTPSQVTQPASSAPANGQTVPVNNPRQDSAASAKPTHAANQDSAQKQGPRPSQPAGSALSSAALAQSAAQSEFLRGQQYLNGSGVPQDPATAAEWFWRSLEAGNTAAALPLADLYIAGKGVSRSCVQARILLDTAARKGSAEAARKLGELPASCD